MKNTKILLVLLIGLFSAQTVISQSSLKRANKQYELSVFAQAINSYKEVLAKNPNHREANVKIADSYRLTNQLEKAIPHYQTALANGGVDAIYAFQYGLTLQGLGDYERAKDVFTNLANNDVKYAIRSKQFAEACDFAMGAHDPPRYKVSNEFVNKSSSDFAPTFYKREDVIYASTRSDITVRNSRNAPGGNSLGANKLLKTKRDRNGYLQSPTTLHSGFGTSTNEGPLSYSKDGRMVAFTKNNFTPGVRQVPSAGMELTMYIAQVDANGDWTNATPFRFNGSGFSTGYPCFSPDGNALFFASDRPGGYGGFDIYVSYRAGNSWAAPQNLGETINSLGNEITPFYDGLSMYFASDFHKGFGGFDIFRAEESNGRWSTLFHGGTGLNSSFDDYGFVFDALYSIGYFVSNREGGKGLEDIYRVEKETDNVVIKVMDEATGTPIEGAIIDFIECEEGAYSTNENGVFNFQMLEELNCNVYIKKDGYLTEPLKLTSMGLRQNRTLEVKLTNYTNAYQGQTVNASNGYFLDNVKIIATDQATGGTSSSFSGAQGGYAISLKPSTSYLLRYSKPGFQDVTLPVKTGENDNRALRNIELLPVGIGGRISPSSTEPAVVTTDPKQANKPSSISPNSGNTTSTSNESTTTPKSLYSGYAVQVAAAKGSFKDITSYKNKLSDLGTVYSVKDGGTMKIRVGIFEDRADAVALQKLIRAKGYSGAFIVSEKDQELPITIQPKRKAEKPATTPATTVSNSPQNGTMIRLATFGNIDYFDKETVDDLGTLTYVKKGNLTVVLLRGYTAMDDAMLALRKAKVRGFPDAHMVDYRDGKITKLK